MCHTLKQPFMISLLGSSPKHPDKLQTQILFTMPQFTNIIIIILTSNTVVAHFQSWIILVGRDQHHQITAYRPSRVN